MSSCGHIQARAAYLAALPAADAEHKLAFEHARSCSACAKALAEGQRVISLIDLHRRCTRFLEGVVPQ